MVKASTKRWMENVAFALQCISDVAIERQNLSVQYLCGELRSLVEAGDDTRGCWNMDHIRMTARQLASDLLAAVKFEWREVVIPFVEVKRPTHNFGAATFPDYFAWLSPKQHYTSEELLGILEEQERKLTIALEHLDKV